MLNIFVSMTKIGATSNSRDFAVGFNFNFVFQSNLTKSLGHPVNSVGAQASFRDLVVPFFVYVCSRELNAFHRPSASEIETFTSWAKLTFILYFFSLSCRQFIAGGYLCLVFTKVRETLESGFPCLLLWSVFSTLVTINIHNCQQ